MVQQKVRSPVTRVVKALPLTSRPATVMFAASLVLSGFGLSAFGLSAQANETLPASASLLRSTVVAMALADAAMPLAGAVVEKRDVPASVPASSAAMKPDTSGAMASMRTTSTRRYSSASDNFSYYDRRFRSYRDPFILILGVAY